jgi:NAD/NADP transhydrogenase beta subunit
VSVESGRTGHREPAVLPEPHTSMLFGDAKKSVGEVIEELEAL